jgi:peptidyl-prolyl cis-trans isomerase B (cyclophilin B)
MASRGAREKAEREARKRARSYSVRQQVHIERGRRRRRDDIVAGVVLVVVLALATTAQVGYFAAGPGMPKPSTSSSTSTTATPATTRTLPPAALSEHRTWTGTMTLNATKLSISLNGAKAPQAVANFVELSQSAFYAGLTCHRLTTSGLYVLQCGDPSGDGTGGPGYTFGPLENVPKDGVYPAGTIAMARGTAENSQGSQFFIVYTASKLPAPGYTVFGKVTGGLAALKTAITSKGVAAGGTSATDGAPKVSVSIGEIALK